MRGLISTLPKPQYDIAKHLFLRGLRLVLSDVRMQVAGFLNVEFSSSELPSAWRFKSRDDRALGADILPTLSIPRARSAGGVRTAYPYRRIVGACPSSAPPHTVSLHRQRRGVRKVSFASSKVGRVARLRPQASISRPARKVS